ncbi:DUF930 domain-containing protein [Ensifer aridi]|uniref:DUF930 domain-containing protein n=1 Tax=Ensifer aridi TaxID=1708715 RepID=UPI00097C58FB
MPPPESRCPELSGVTLHADGGALRSKQHWYNVKFRCEVTPDLGKVVAFEFSVGAENSRKRVGNTFSADWRRCIRLGTAFFGGGSTVAEKGLRSHRNTRKHREEI